MAVACRFAGKFFESAAALGDMFRRRQAAGNQTKIMGKAGASNTVGTESYTIGNPSDLQSFK